jgi:hypothetical protein
MFICYLFGKIYNLSIQGKKNHYIHFNGCIPFITFFKPLKNESHHVPLLLNQVLKLKFQINIGYLNSIQTKLLLLYLRWFKYVQF